MEWVLACLMVSGVYLDESLRSTLKEAALTVLRDGKEKLSFKTDDGEGIVRKERDYMPFLGDGGPLFSADVETDRGKGKIVFILPERYLNLLNAGARFGEGVWLDSKPQRAANGRWN